MKLKLFRFLILIFILAGGFLYWNWRQNVYSKEVLKLEILGPEKVTIGKEAEFIVKYKNNGKFRLEEPELLFEPPENSLKGDQFATNEILKEELGGAIYPGEERTFSFKLKIFGKEGELKTAKATMSFKPKNLKARYKVNTSFSTQIQSIPITFEFDLPSRVEPGKVFAFRVDYFSNVDAVLSNLRVQIDYPPAFEFLNSLPKSIEKNEWEIPVLNRADGGRIEIQGRILDEIGKAKIFRARLGVVINNQIVILKEIEKGVELVKPSISLRQEINGNPEYVAAPGEWLHYTIYFKNVGDEEMQNLFLISKLEGDAFDFRTLRSELGEVKPGDNSVIFDWKKVSKLQYLAPTDEGKVDFWIKLKDDLGNVKNPILKNKVFILQIKEEFITKISSKVEIVQRGFYFDEIFGNSGPIPPKVGHTTTYTISWQLKNYYSDVQDVKVRATLPEYVTITGKIFPEEMVSKFSFDPISREVVWSLGDLKRTEGIDTPSPNIFFQIAFTPTESQLAQTPEIISEARVSGQDTWTGKILEATSPPLTTILPDDIEMKPEMGIVQ